jgi:transketolase
MPDKTLDARSKKLRSIVVDALKSNGGGHIGSSMSTIEILRVLYDSILNFDASHPGLPERDRFILSKGHGCLALYSILADKKFFPIEELQTFCKPTSKFGGHPERGKVPGVEASTGALGHGLPIGVGLALALRMKRSSSRVFVLTGDGEINEGSNWEALMAAAKHRLSNLTVLVDYNKVQSYGRTSDVLDLEPLVDKLKSFGFITEEVDGHDVVALEALFKELPFKNDSPSAVVCHTVKGRGLPFAEGNSEWHHKSGLTGLDFQNMYEIFT